MKKLLIGTTNKAKIDEYKQLLSEFDFKIVSFKDLGIPEPEETAKTFEGNALLKAKYYFEKSKIPTLVDDGGFEIDALNGEPGVKSHRWLGRRSSDEELITETIKRMSGKSSRTCRLTLVLAVASNLGIITSHAEIEGVVADKPSGNRMKGFPFR